MILKWIFDRVVSVVGLLFLWPVLLVVAILVKVKMPGGPAFFVQKRVGKDGKMVKGVANVLLGGEGLFNTTLTGPGHITIQTMPISKTAMVLYAQMPHKS